MNRLQTDKKAKFQQVIRIRKLKISKPNQQTKPPKTQQT